MANARPSKLGVQEPKQDKKQEPVIQYFGEGADKVKFDIDPKATLIRVYSNGTVLVDY